MNNQSFSFIQQIHRPQTALHLNQKAPGHGLRPVGGGSHKFQIRRRRGHRRERWIVRPEPEELCDPPFEAGRHAPFGRHLLFLRGWHDRSGFFPCVLLPRKFELPRGRVDSSSCEWSSPSGIFAPLLAKKENVVLVHTGGEALGQHFVICHPSSVSPESRALA